MIECASPPKCVGVNLLKTHLKFANPTLWNKGLILFILANNRFSYLSETNICNHHSTELRTSLIFVKMADFHTIVENQFS